MLSFCQHFITPTHSTLVTAHLYIVTPGNGGLFAFGVVAKRRTCRGKQLVLLSKLKKKNFSSPPTSSSLNFMFWKLFVSSVRFHVLDLRGFNSAITFPMNLAWCVQKGLLCSTINHLENVFFINSFLSHFGDNAILELAILIPAE